ncbi:MAG: CRISPR-associated protein Cas4 [Methanobacteriaceae archaeon]
MEEGFSVTGLMVQYYVACKRELWFFLNRIDMNYADENVQIGRLIHEKSYSREKKSINLGEVAFDFAKTGKDITLFEIKKSSKLQEPVRWQLYYYMWYVKQSTEKNVKGVIVYPKEKKREKLELNSQIENRIQEIIEGIEKIRLLNSPPPIKLKPYCKGCMYYELCMV